MKKEYIIPVLKTIQAIQPHSIIATSAPEEVRQVDGEPATDGVAPSVSDGSLFDPYNGHGQDPISGGGNRSKYRGFYE